MHPQEEIKDDFVSMTLREMFPNKRAMMFLLSNTELADESEWAPLSYTGMLNLIRSRKPNTKQLDEIYRFYLEYMQWESDNITLAKSFQIGDYVSFCDDQGDTKIGTLVAKLDMGAQIFVKNMKEITYRAYLQLTKVNK